MKSGVAKAALLSIQVYFVRSIQTPLLEVVEQACVVVEKILHFLCHRLVFAFLFHRLDVFTYITISAESMCRVNVDVDVI